ncbi:MAG TPA: hypothetical protein VGR50_04240 [Terriglobales bacterium]|nr:hypothetical protein [Terriglobales bacterium]
MSKILGIANVTSESTSSRLSFESEQRGAISLRFLRVDEKRAYEFGITCNTCHFWFERLPDANRTVTAETVATKLQAGITDIEGRLVRSVLSIFPAGDYLVALMSFTPKLVTPCIPDDYFSKEVVDLWGIEGFWGLPHYPKTEYYRTGSLVFDGREQLFEFVIPMFPHNWLKPKILADCQRELGVRGNTTALGLAVLDVKGPAVLNTKHEPEVTQHWCLATFVLDGHHRIYAASQSSTPMTMLTFIAINHGISSREQLDRVVRLLSGAPVVNS